MNIFAISDMNGQCYTFEYKGSGILSTSSGCVTQLTIPTVDISLNVSSPCSIVNTPSFVSAKDNTTNIAYGNGVNVPVGATLNIVYQATINDGTANKVVTLNFAVLTKENIPPTLSGVPNSVTISCNPSNPAGITASDNCDSNPKITYTQTGSASACATGGVITRTWIAQDKSGNTKSAVQTITVLKDIEKPVLATTAVNKIVACGDWSNELSTWLDNRAGSSATDGCGATTVHFTVNKAEKLQTEIVDIFIDSLAKNKCKDNVNVGGGLVDKVNAEIEVGFFYTDPCGNASDTTYAKLVSKDDTTPVVDFPAQDLTIECDTANIAKNLAFWINNAAGAQFSDGCSGIRIKTEPTLAHALDSLSISQASSCGNTAKVKVKFIGLDNCGNESPASIATFSVVDTQKPKFTKLPTAKIIECKTGKADSLNAFITNRGGATATDGCSNVTWSYFWKERNGTIGQSPTLPTIKDGCSWYADFSFIATDECNNRDTAKVRFTVNDTQAPVFSNIPTNITLNCGMSLPPVPSVTAIDGCNNKSTVTYKGESNNTWATCAKSFSIMRTWEAVDSCGNKAIGTQMIYFTDTERPTLLNTPTNVTVDCTSIPTIPNNITATDACDSIPKVTFSQISTKGTNAELCSFYNYTISRTWVATDKCSNSVSYTQVITVRDLAAPVFTLPNDTSVECFQLNELSLTGEPDEIRDCDASPDITFKDVFKAGNGTSQALSVVERTWKATDACGNITTAIQKITLQDNEPPIFGIDPQDLTLNCGTLIPDITITAKDSCDMMFNSSTNIYIEEDYMIDDNCVTFKVLRTWTATDKWGNSSQIDQLVTYVDNVAPKILNCPIDMTIGNDLNSCDGTVTLIAPIVDDNCGSYTIPRTKAISKPISSTDPGSLTTPVKDITLDFAVALDSLESVSNIKLRIDLKNTDGEDVQEYFNVIGEDGTVLGKTNKTASQCGNGTTILTTLTANQFYAWVQDKNIRIKLTPNIPVNTAFAINDICPSATADVSLSYDVKTIPKITYSYKIDNASPVSNKLENVTKTLSPGTHKVVYYVKDCSNNVDSCNFKITIKDTQKPSMTNPYASDLLLSLSNDCEALSVLLLPTPISENCSFGTSYSQKQLANSDSLLTFSYDPNYLTNFADDIVFTFSGITQSTLGQPGTLKINLKAKANTSDAYFDIYGENNTYLGRTSIATCSNSSETILSISASRINQWASDGQIVINAIRFKGIPISAAGTNPGLSACTTVTNNKDGVSWMTASLSYNTAIPTYYVTGATSVAPTLLLKAGVGTRVNFKRGNSKVFYVLGDAAGNKDTISFNVFANDGINPVARCKSAIASVNPFASTNTAIDPLLIDAGSTDNCGIFSRTVIPASFNCNDAGQTKTVTLTVADSSGRTNSCTATVFVESITAKPSYKLGICGSDTLELFSNPPTAVNNVVYTYQWTGPNNFVSTEANPKIPSVSVAYSGTYNVTVTNPFAACTITGSITIPINSLPNTPILNVSSTKPCTNSELILTTQPYSGKKIKYKWYKGLLANAVLLDSTTVPSYSIINPTDTAKYYVIVTIDGCTSNASAPIQVSPVKPIVATTTNASIIEICEGENIALGTTKTGLGYNYQWSGPNGFSSTTQYPTVIVGAKPLNSGIYTLIIVANGCESAPISTQVNVKAKPATPQIAANGRDCEGATINLITNILDATSYRWIKPDFTEEPTQTNTLILNSLSTNKRGNWRVYAIKDGCRSDESPVIELVVNPKPNVTASYQAPVCEGGQLTLNGTAPVGSSYVWSNASGVIGNTQNVSTIAQSGIYVLSAIAPNGCDNTSSISVTPVPAPQITTISSNAAGACVTGSTNAMLTPTISPFNNDLNYSYQWTGPNVSSTEKILVIPNVSAAANGNYTLVVMTGAGCQSKPFTYNLGVKNIPQTPIIKGSLTQNVCEGDDILLELENSYSGTKVSYKWKTPAGDTTVSNPTFKLIGVKTFNSGDYSVKVIVDGCESNNSGTKKINVNPLPAKPEITTNSPVCEGGNIKLTTPQIAGASYDWSGPGFSSGIAEPIITNADKDKEGLYKLRVTVNGCTSPYSTSALVIVNPTPTQIPSVKSITAVCMDNPNPSAMLSVEPTSAISGATYVWYNSNNAVISGAPTTQLNYGLNLSAFAKKDTTYEFYVIATINGCPSKASVPTVLTTNKIPNQQAFAGADIFVCDASSITLNAAQPIIGSGNWLQTEGSSITIANPTSSNTAVNGLVSGQNYTLQWKLSNGACRDYAFDELKIKVNDTSFKAEAGDSINVCSKNSVQLNAKNLPSGITGEWTQFASQELLGVKIAEPTNPKTTITGLTPGNKYTFKWTISNTACKDYSNDEVIVTVASPQGVAQTEVDKKVCGNATTISAASVAGVIGTWSAVEVGSQIQIVSPNSANTSVKNLKTGSNKLIWALSNAVCGTYSVDTLTITTEPAAIASDDNVNVPYAGNVEIAVIQNDIIPANGYTLNISVQPKHGSVKVITGGTKIEYKANNGYAGADDFEYELCNAACPDACTNAKVFINVLGGNDCTVPTIITPNGDLTNDRWEIPCLANTQFSNNTVVVFNQWGDEVFRANGYKNDWEGTYNGKNLPEGTYFFVIDFGNGEKRNGFLMIER